jgi:hypothetical protein
MPVWVSTDETVDLNKDNKRRRHINSDCPVYQAVPKAVQSPVKGRPNTTRLQEITARCEDPGCWEAWERDIASKKTKKGGAKKTSTKGAATAPTVKVGGAAADLAAKVKAARKKPAIAAKPVGAVAAAA